MIVWCHRHLVGSSSVSLPKGQRPIRRQPVRWRPIISSRPRKWPRSGPGSVVHGPIRFGCSAPPALASPFPSLGLRAGWPAGCVSFPPPNQLHGCSRSCYWIGWRHSHHLHHYQHHHHHHHHHRHHHQPPSTILWPWRRVGVTVPVGVRSS